MKNYSLVSKHVKQMAYPYVGPNWFWTDPKSFWFNPKLFGLVEAFLEHIQIWTDPILQF